MLRGESVQPLPGRASHSNNNDMRTTTTPAQGTATTTRPRTGSTTAASHPPADALTVEELTAPAEVFCRIMVAVQSHVVRYLAAQTPYIVSRYGAEVWHFVLPAVHAIDSERKGLDSPALTEAKLAPFRLLARANRRGRSRGFVRVPVFMSADDWQDVRAVAARLDCGEAEIIRAGLARRMVSLMEFHEKVRTGEIPTPPTVTRKPTDGISGRAG